MSTGRWRVHRFVPRCVHALPLGHGGAASNDEEAEPFRSWMNRIGSPRVEALRREGWDDPRIASALVEDILRAVDMLRDGAVTRARGFDTAFLVGDILDMAGVRSALRARSAPYGLVLGESTRDCVSQGAQGLLEHEGEDPDAIVVDVGHGAIRAMTLGGEPVFCTLQRNFQRLPASLGAADDAIGDHHRRTCVTRAGDFLGRALVSALVRTRVVPPVAVLSLPCELDETGLPGACSYPGWTGNRELFEVLFERVDEHLTRARGHGTESWDPPSAVEVHVVSHVELMALAARRLGGEPTAAGTLVLSLDFDPAGAMLRCTA